MIPSGIDPHQTIYRFLDLFNLYKLINDRQLRFTSLHKLDDKNEGLGKVLRSIELSLAFPIEPDEYSIIKNTTYVSCWTKLPDNIAMWMLYSPDKVGIRIRTTVAKLYAAIESYKMKYPYYVNKIDKLRPKDIDVFEMDYKDLRKAKKEIEEKNNTAITAMREATKGKPKADACRAWYKALREHSMDNVLDNDAMKYKDHNYFHEQEIRGQIEFEATTEDEYEYMMYCGFKGFAKFIWLTVDDDFVEEICIDPRCPEYREQILKKIIDPKGKLKFVKSEAFGVIP